MVAEISERVILLNDTNIDNYAKEKIVVVKTISVLRDQYGTFHMDE